MPILPSAYFGSWYVVTMDNAPRLLTSFNETFNNPTSNNKMIQGDIGNHIISVDPGHYQVTINSPILLIEPIGAFSDVFDIVLENLNRIQHPVDISNVTDYNYVLQSASLNLTTESSNVTATLESWKTFNDAQNFKTYNPNIDFTARQVKFYDIQIGIFGSNYIINQANLQISIQSDKHFYVPGSNNFYGNQVPIYSINGYTVSGDVTVLVDPDQYETLKLYNAQSPGVFNALQNSLFFKILNRVDGNINDKTLNLGDFMFMPSVELSISANQIITARINFVTMFRRTSSITY